MPGQDPPTYLSRPSVTVASPAITVRSGQFVKISGWVRVAVPIVASLVQLLFFVTPVLYDPGHLGRFGALVALNPATHFIAILRAPLLGQPAPPASWVAVLAMLAAGGAEGPA